MNIKRLRKKLKLKQKDLAKIIGCSDSSVSHWEAGRRNPNKWIIEKLKELNKK